MNKYGVLIHGSGYEALEGYSKSAGKGFYITVFVEALGVDAACQRAIDTLVNSEMYIAAFLPMHRNNMKLEIEAVDELFSFDDTPYPMSGFVFYAEDDTDNNVKNG